MLEVTLRDITDDNWMPAIYAGDAVAGHPWARSMVHSFASPEAKHGH